MAIVNWNNGFFPSVNSLFDDILSRNNWPSREVEVSIPAVNVSESDDAYTLELVAPGKSKEDFNIQVKNNSLIISSETEHSEEEETKQYTRKEYNFSSFRRQFQLPPNATDEHITANYENGLLTVTVPKQQKSLVEGKSIQVG